MMPGTESGVTINALAPAVIQTPLVDAMPAEQVKANTDKIPMKRCGTLEEIAASLGPKAKIVKINIDENQQTPAQFGVRGIPTLMLFKAGSVEATKVGALSKSQLVAFLDGHL